MNKKLVQLLTISNFNYYNNLYCLSCNNKNKKNNQNTENIQNEKDKKKIKQKTNDQKQNKKKQNDENNDKKINNDKKENKKLDKIKTDKEKYIEKTNELRKKFTEYEKIINGKKNDDISFIVSNHLCGFHNYGSTCYFNAAIQNLTHNKDLVKAILDYVADSADKDIIDIEIIIFYYLIVKIYEEEEDRKKDNKTRTIDEELNNLRYFIALKGIDIDKISNERVDNFLSTSKQSDSAELLNNIISDIRTIIDEEDKEKPNIYKKDIIQNILCYNFITSYKCENNACTYKEEKHNIYENIASIEMKTNNLNENLEKFTKVDDNDNLSKCEFCSKEKADKYKKNHNNEILKIQNEFKICNDCKIYFNEIENCKKNNKFSKEFENSTKNEDGYRFYKDKDKKNILASLLTDKTTGLIYNSRCDECKKKHKEFSKNLINYRNKSVKLEFNGKYFIVQNKRFECDFTTMTTKKIKDDINFEEKLKLEPGKHSVKREVNFNLVGIICHNGEPNAGHYYSYNKINEKWYLFNDDKVYEVDNNDILNIPDIKSKNYLLFYKKQ